MASKFDGDVCPLSNDPRYMHTVFTGLIDDAIAQAKAAPDHGLSNQYVPAGMSRSRAALLQHLNLLQVDPVILQRYLNTIYYAPRKEPKRVPGSYTLAYAMARWPQNFDRQMWLRDLAEIEGRL